MLNTRTRKGYYVLYKDLNHDHVKAKQYNLIHENDFKGLPSSNDHETQWNEGMRLKPLGMRQPVKTLYYINNSKILEMP